MEKSNKRKRDEKQERKEEEEMKMKVTNGVLLDSSIEYSYMYQIQKYKGKVMNCHLTYTDCGSNNNKFYIIQGLNKYCDLYIWTRWGRVGTKGTSAMIACGQSDKYHYSIYQSKVREKINKGYTEIKMDYDECKEEESRKGVNSKLPKKIQNLMKFIFDMNLIEKNMIKVGYDPKKLPLGKLSKDTIYKGFSTLKDIEKELQNKNSREKLSQLSSEFFRFIPHDFKYENVGKFVINTKEKLKDKLALVDSLKEIQIASEIARSLKSKDSLHSHDIKYNNLKCKIESLSLKSKEYKTLSEAINIDHSSTNSFKVTIQEIFKICREGESEKFKSEIGNKTLLWHGSNFVNWGGILSQGLRIAPPEAPTCGFMFGKGVYFADVFHKSADYSCFLNSKNVGLIALCDVALGNTNDIIREDSSLSLSTLPKGTNSTKGCGKFIPSRTIEIDGSKLHIGPLKTNDENNELTHNEYICYDEDQIQLKYLLMCKFDI